MSDTWVNVYFASREHAPALVMADKYGADKEPDDEKRVAVRLSEGDDGVVLFGTPEQLVRFGQKLVERHS